MLLPAFVEVKVETLEHDEREPRAAEYFSLLQKNDHILMVFLVENLWRTR